MGENGYRNTSAAFPNRMEQVKKQQFSKQANKKLKKKQPSGFNLSYMDVVY